VKPPKYTPARPRLGAPGVVANARHSPRYVCAAFCKFGLAQRAAALSLGCDLTVLLD